MKPLLYFLGYSYPHSKATPNGLSPSTLTLSLNRTLTQIRTYNNKDEISIAVLPNVINQSKGYACLVLSCLVFVLT